MNAAMPWCGRAQLTAFDNVRAARGCAIASLSNRPDTCAWQTRAADSSHHVTAYCLIEDAITRVERSLSDERFDGVNPSRVTAFDDIRLAYLYDTYACWAEQLLREVGYLLSQPRDRTQAERTFDRYVNSVVKHRNEGGEDRRARAYGAIITCVRCSSTLRTPRATWLPPAGRSPGGAITGRDCEFCRRRAPSTGRCTSERFVSAARRARFIPPAL